MRKLIPIQILHQQIEEITYVDHGQSHVIQRSLNIVHEEIEHQWL